jgi:hypothetical protein
MTVFLQSEFICTSIVQVRNDPATFRGIAALMLFTTLVSCYLHARPAPRAHPTVTLQYHDGVIPTPK